MTRPRVRVGGRFAGEVSGVEFGKGGVDVVGVEHDGADDPLLGVDLDDVEHLGVEDSPCSGRRTRADTNETRRSPRVAMTADVMFIEPDVADHSHVSRSAASRPCRTPAFTTRRRSSQ